MGSMRCEHSVIPGVGRAMLAVVLGVLLGLGIGGCTVGFDVTDESNQFSCLSDDDCVEGFRCYFTEGSTMGSCRTSTADPPGCVDRDGDGYLGGENCTLSPELFDCNDDPLASGALVYPLRQEICDNIDQDCDNLTDEDIAPRLCDYQAGVCAGVMASCASGAWQDCIAAGLYGPDFELVPEDQERCDGLDNNCSGGYPVGAGPEVIDEHCACLPGVTPPTSCGVDIGICERGIKFCQPTGGFTACVVTDMGQTCNGDGDCESGGYCVTEAIDYREDLGDECIHGLPTEPGCNRKVCRYLMGSTPCETNANCGTGQACVEDACQDTTAINATEVCNGLDDNCNGRLDEGVCSPCPGFNMIYFPSMPTSPSGLCVDMYEASRADATDVEEGSVELYGANQPDALPWTGVTDTSAADAACRGTAMNALITGAVPAKRLCQRAELQASCGGSFPYGESYVASRCNESGTVEPTGSFESCVTSGGIFDLAGNVAELFSSPFAGVFGGSAGESGATDVSCGADPPLSEVTIEDDFIGFRCCALPIQ